MKRLGILCCTKTKIWAANPHAGSTLAMDAYRGDKFLQDRAIVSQYCDRWVILSAKYGFMDPDLEIPESYDVTFSKPRTTENLSIEVSRLTEQIGSLGLDSFSIIRLFSSCGAEYERRIREAFGGLGTNIGRVYE